MDFITMAAGAFELGWRFDDALTAEVRSALADFMPLETLLERFSERREVDLPEYAIAATTRSAEDLLESLDDDELDQLETIAELCDALDRMLAPQGLRVPTEDELEAACGGGLFAWGDAVPDGVPWGTGTTFVKHKQPNALGLLLNDDPYRVEVTRAAFKLGDGGEAICGAYPWPVPWLSFAPSYRVAGESAEDLLFEFLESARVRPVRCG